MAEAAVRIALLARPGSARDQLHRALTDLGAILVAEGDPAELDPVQVAGLSPSLVLVSLEPAIESALDRFDALLATPGVEVMYDDAEVTRQLDGWDLNRWARHLAAKLLGAELLPPAPLSGTDPLPNLDLSPVPGAVPTPAELMSHARLEDYTHDTHGLADNVPINPSLTEVAIDIDQSAEDSPAEDLGMGAMDFDIGGIETAMQTVHADVPAAEPAAIAAPEEDVLELDQTFEIDFDMSSFDAVSSETADNTSNLLKDDDNSQLLADIDFNAEPVRFSNFDDQAPAAGNEGMDADVAALAAQLDAFEKGDQRQAASDPDFSLDFATDEKADVSKPVPAKTGQAAAKPANYDLSGLSLTSLDEPVSPSPAVQKRNEPAARDTSHLSLQSLDEPVMPAPGAKIATRTEASAAATTSDFGEFSLDTLDELDATQAGAEASAAGMVLIIAGMGGPDAVRQMLSSLPESMPVPVLLYQHLEVGKHERLVEQLAKISRIPVQLAEGDSVPKACVVSVLPAGMSAQADGGTLRFCAGTLVQLISALPAKNSVVVLLSGAEAALVPAVRMIEQAGGLTLAQDPDSCFDPAAAQALKRLGSQTYPALGLARQVAARWSL